MRSLPSEALIAIVGGGPAGLAAALFLAHHRPELLDRVVVLEKERYPRDKYCAGALGGRGDALLSSIGAAAEVPSVFVSAVSASLGQHEIEARLLSGPIGRVVRRIEFDEALSRIARSRGIALFEGTPLTRVEWLSGGGCALATPAGSVKARVVVGADGVGSVVRRAMSLPFGMLRAQVVEVDTELAAPSDERRDRLHFDLRDRGVRGYSWDFPTLVEGVPMVCRGSYVLSEPNGRVACDPSAVLKARLDGMGLDLQRYRIKRFAERGFEPGLGLSRPGALLIGEAAGIDPMLGEGIPQALAYGALAGKYLAECIDRNNYQFDDWSTRVRTSRFGVDMRLRRRILEPFFSLPREVIEDFLAAEPEFLQIGVQYFGGQHVSRLRLLRFLPKLAALGVRVGWAAYGP